MRADMSKVVIERPRSGGKCTTRGTYAVDRGYRSKSGWYEPVDEDDLDVDLDDHFPRGMSLRKVHKIRGDWKEFSDLLGPLEGFLRSRCGRKWDNVYSEISEHLNRDSTTHAHIYQHLYQFVDVKTVAGENGEVIVHDGYPTRRTAQFYVCPFSGLLLRNVTYRSYTRDYRERRRAAEEEKLRRRREIDGLVYERLEGVWYHLFEKVVDSIVGPYSVQRKRQLGKREIKRLGLYTGPA
jgi:hypothetical protein